MNVANLQTLLRNHAGFLADAGAGPKIVADLQLLAHGFEPLTALKLDELFVLLQQADEYRRTGVLPVAAGKAKAVKALKASDAEQLKLALATLMALEDNAASEDFRFEDLEAELKTIGKLTVPNLKIVARDFGLTNIPTKKGDILEALGRKIKDRREADRRTRIGTNAGGIQGI